MMKIKFIITIICVYILICCQSNGDNDNVQTPPRPVKYVKVGGSDITGVHSFTGLAKAQNQASLSFKVSGTVNSIKVKVGDRVRSGEPLATLDPTDYQVNHSQTLANVQSAQAQIESAEAQLESAKASYINAESNYQRYEKLYEHKSVSLSDFEQVKSSYLSAQASYKAAQTQVDAAKANNQFSESQARSASNQVGYTRLIAPFSGIVTSIDIETNESVNQGSPVIEINSELEPDVEIGVPENFIALIKPDQKVSVDFHSIEEKSFTGKVREIGFSSVGTTYPVTIRLIDKDERIRPGMPASAIFRFEDTNKSKQYIIVPPSAVGADEDGKFVYVLKNEGGKYFTKKTTVQVGELNDSGFKVIKGLVAGDMVASAGLNVLRDRMEVQLYHHN